MCKSTLAITHHCGNVLHLNVIKSAHCKHNTYLHWASHWCKGWWSNTSFCSIHPSMHNWATGWVTPTWNVYIALLVRLQCTSRGTFSNECQYHLQQLTKKCVSIIGMTDQSLLLNNDLCFLLLSVMLVALHFNPVSRSVGHSFKQVKLWGALPMRFKCTIASNAPVDNVMRGEYQVRVPDI